MKEHIKIILFALEQMTKWTKEATHPLYSTVAANKIQEATKLIKEVEEILEQ